jgi:hypothetical protein
VGLDRPPLRIAEQTRVQPVHEALLDRDPRLDLVARQIPSLGTVTQDLDVEDVRLRRRHADDFRRGARAALNPHREDDFAVFDMRDAEHTGLEHHLSPLLLRSMARGNCDDHSVCGVSDPKL